MRQRQPLAAEAAFTSAATGSLNPAIALCNVIYLLGLTRRLAGVFRDALLDIGHRPGKRFAQLLCVSCVLRFTEICNLDQQPIQQIGNAYIFRMPGSQGRDLPPHLAEIERLVFRRPLQNDTRAWPANERDAPSMMARRLAGVNPDGAMSGEQT